MSLCFCALKQHAVGYVRPAGRGQVLLSQARSPPQLLKYWPDQVVLCLALVW